jgi:toxin YoeB
MRSLVFEGNTWAVYEALGERDKKLHKALKKILKEMLRSDPSRGLGKPEQLRHNLAGFWSRRISLKDRLIYKYDDQYIYIFAIGGHYDRTDSSFRPAPLSFRP